MPTVLIVLPSNTYRAADFIDAARTLRVELVIASDQSDAVIPTMRHRFLSIPLDDPDRAAAAIVEQDHVTPLDAVVAVDDGGVLTAARAAAQLGLRHNDPEAISTTRDKAKMRRALATTEVTQPAFRVVDHDDAITEAAAAVGYPVVVKPVSLSGSQGVIRVDDEASLAAATKRIRRILRDGGRSGEPLLVERFVPGGEVAVEGVVTAGDLEVLAVFDKPDPLDGPFFEETMFVTPSRLDNAVQQEAIGLVRRAVRAIGLTEGPVHAEARIGPDGPVLLEVAARSIGGLCGRSLRFSVLGRTLEEILLRNALGLRSGDTTRLGASGALMIPTPGSGTFTAIEGVAEAESIPGITGIEMTVHPGSRVATLPEGDRYLGFVFARGATPARVEQSLRRAGAVLRVTVEDRAPV